MTVSGKQKAVGSKNTVMSEVVFCLTVCAMLFALCFPAWAQQHESKIPRIGFVQRRVAPTPNNPDPLAAALRQGLRDLGYVEGKNILIEHRYAQGQADRLPSLVAELVQLKVDILVIPTAPGIRAAKRATKTIPIVVVTPADPITAGFVESLARPAGNLRRNETHTGSQRKTVGVT